MGPQGQLSSANRRPSLALLGWTLLTSHCWNQLLNSDLPEARRASTGLSRRARLRAGRQRKPGEAQMHLGLDSLHLWMPLAEQVTPQPSTLVTKPTAPNPLQQVERPTIPASMMQQSFSGMLETFYNYTAQ